MTAVAEKFLEITVIAGSKLNDRVRIPDSLNILDKALPAAGHGVMRVLTIKDGDKRVTWDARSFEQITDAKAMFDDLVSKGQVPYKVGLNGKATSEVMTTFDPHAEEIIFLPVALLTGG